MFKPFSCNQLVTKVQSFPPKSSNTASPIIARLSSLRGVLIKFFGNSWKHGNPGDFFGFEIFDFGIVLGRVILAAATVSLLYCAGILGGIQNLYFYFSCYIIHSGYSYGTHTLMCICNSYGINSLLEISGH